MPLYIGSHLYYIDLPIHNLYETPIQKIFSQIWVRLNKRHKSPIGFFVSSHSMLGKRVYLRSHQTSQFFSCFEPEYLGSANSIELTIRSSEKSNSPYGLKCFQNPHIMTLHALISTRAGRCSGRNAMRLW